MNLLQCDQSVISSSECHEDAASISTGTRQSVGARSGYSSASLAQEETAAIKKSKKLVIFVLLAAAAVIGGLTYYFLSSEEERDFRLQFHDNALEISELVHQKATNVFLSVQSFSTAVTSHAIATNSTWPFVTMPDFEVRGMQSNKLANSLMTGFSPIIHQSSKDQWEGYSVKNQGWIKEGVEYNIELNEDFIEEGTFEADPISEVIFRTDNGERVAENGVGPFLPVWQTAPAPHDDWIVNYNLLSHPAFDRIYHGMLHTMEPVLSEVLELNWLYEGSIRHVVTHPHSFLLQPVYRDFKRQYTEKDVSGFVYSVLPWDHYFENILSDEAENITVVLEDTCNQSFTYVVNGPKAFYVGTGDLHDPAYTDMVVETEFSTSSNLEVSSAQEHCEFFLRIYPTMEMGDAYKTKTPVICAIAILSAFFLTLLVFIIYDYLVERRQDKVMATAKRSNAIVSSLFPSNVHDRIMNDAEGQVDAEKAVKRDYYAAAKNQLKNFLDEDAAEEHTGVFGGKPIADLFPSATVMFADIVGFTAWSSMREPCQVFQLLETLYHAFDEHAKRRRVFKVETIGDCYVAVSGLPEPRKDHVVVMARFAGDCLSTMNDLSKKLELLLGPDTADLSLRIGIHSGPVTAGVLRGEKLRFQLFGDTMNTAARIESNGERNRIHASQETADLLCAAGKSHWVSARQNKIVAKGKGELQTYWLDLKAGQSTKFGGSTTSVHKCDVPPKTNNLKSKAAGEAAILRSNAGSSMGSGTADSASSSVGTGVNSGTAAANISNANAVQSVDNLTKLGGSSSGMKKPILSDKMERLVSWNTDVLVRLLKQIVARRNASERQSEALSELPLTIETGEGSTVLDEVKEIIELPRFDGTAARKQENPKQISLDPNVTDQLRDYVTIIATMYRDNNPFHNFEHASHVTMSVVKLLSRIVAPDEDLFGDAENSESFDKNLHCHTYGITSDPLTQFSVVFAALIHDTDHSGVPNSQLVKEKASIATTYKNKSVAEQNSVDIAWDLLMDDNFQDLRAIIYISQDEFKRFRQLVVNAVMATDICDKELKELRNARWDKAFHNQEGFSIHASKQAASDDINRKATIVIEHLIQASDVAHTMQHWHIYRKWNERFFQEQLHAYQSGRAEQDPAESWYKGEIGFFDFYIIPLAKKLKDCGVFGVSSDEYLNYAMANRKEWEAKGQEVVAEMIAKYTGKRSSCVEDLGDSWFASMDAAANVKQKFGADFIGIIKTAHSRYPKKWLEKTMKEWSGG